MGFREKITVVLFFTLVVSVFLIIRQQNKINSCMEIQHVRLKDTSELRINQSEALYQVISGSLHVKLSGSGQQPSQSKTTTQDSNQKNVQQQLDESTARKKVLLFAYMKGGSTFVGELFNQFPNSVYFYEPVAGLYSALYASPDWTFPLEILLNTNGTFRDIPKKEFDSITSYMKQLYKCDIPHLPLEYLQHQGLWLSSSTHGYRRCLLDEVKSQYGRTFNYMDHLMFSLGDHCPTSIQKCQERGCDLFMDISRIEHQTGAFSKLHGSLRNETLLRNFRQKRKIFERAAEKCMEKLHVPCVTSQLMVVKALRLTMEMVRTLLRDDKQLKLVYLVRDPRGILMSRKTVQYLSQVFQPNMESEALLLCPKIARDLEGFLTLTSEFGNRVLLLRYEDAADQPQQTVDRVYKFVGMRASTTIREWVKRNTHATSDGDSFDTKRANSSATAHAWREKIPPNLKHRMDLTCAKLIQKLGYRL